VLVKWWLLAIPHYLLVGLFADGGLWVAWRADTAGFDWGSGGLIGLLVLVAGVLLLVTGSYPRPIYDFVLGMDRWVVRVAVYAALMSDRYPPFRLDMDGPDPAGPVGTGPDGDLPDAARPHEGPAHRWTAGRIASVVVGSLLALVSVGLLSGGATLLWADRAYRGADGFLSSASTITTDGYAVTSEPVALAGTAGEIPAIAAALDDVRIKVRNEKSRSAGVRRRRAGGRGRGLSVRGPPRHRAGLRPPGRGASRIGTAGRARPGRVLGEQRVRNRNPDRALADPRRTVAGRRHERRRLTGDAGDGGRRCSRSRPGGDRGRHSRRRRPAPGDR
jgi:hypothetical protein